MRRAATTGGLLIGIFGLVLQFVLSMQMSAGVGRSVLASIEFFFSFFTVLTNIAAALVYTAVLSGHPAWFTRPPVATAVAVAISVVSITYATILAQLWQPAGWLFVADATLHYVAPVVFVLWWLAFGRSGTSRLADIPRWLAYPLIYLAFVMLRGTMLAQYPYPFLDLTVKSTSQVATASVLMLGLFLIVSLAAVAADRMLPAPGHH